MRKHYKRKAWLLDDNILLEGYVSKKVFYPLNTGCGFDSQKIKRKDIQKTIFYNENYVKNMNLEIYR